MPKKTTDTAAKRLVLLDSHAILHRAYHALPDFSTARGEPTGALYGLSTMLISVIEHLKPDYIVACYDVKGPTYRHEAYKDYKAGRQKTDDDLIAQIIRSRDIFKALDIPIYDKEGFEADDMLGTIVEQVRVLNAAKKGDGDRVDVVIASGDMDTLQLVHSKNVQVYTLKKGIKDTVMYDEDAVRTRYGFGPELIPDYKGLRGDPSDNIIGVKGIGDKTATALITTFGTIEDIYKELEAKHDDKFAAAGITPRIVELLRVNREEAEFSKMLATIRRDAPISFALPEAPFKASLDMKKVKELWNVLEFRTLSQRLEKAIVGVEESKRQKSAGNAQEKNAGTNAGEKNAEGTGEGQKEKNTEKGARVKKKASQIRKDGGLFGGADEIVAPDGKLVDPIELERTLIALWLVNSNLSRPTLDDALNFANTDSFETAKGIIFAELDKRDARGVYEKIELPLMPVMARMNARGIRVDASVLARLSKDYHTELAKIEKEIWKHAGVEFNIHSPKQLGEILFDKMGLTVKGMKKTSGGARSTKESELEKLRDLHPIVPLVFEYRELSKLLSTYIDAIPPQLDKDGRLHSRFLQSGTTTGRMASLDPNLQNIPIKTELGRAIRTAFVAEEGFVLAGFDYSQMELRIAAFLSGDERLIEIFRKGEDVHASVAASVFRVPQAEVTPEMRRRAKVINFGIMYGMGVLALKQNLGTSREEAQKFLNDYFEAFSGLARYLDMIKAETARKGYTETLYGRRRYFEGIHSKIPYIRASAERMAINAPIQGTEADVIKLAMIRIDEYVKKEGLENDVFPLLQVHDELIYEIRESKAQAVAGEIERIMESIVDMETSKGIVLTAEHSLGKNWGQV